MNLGCLSRNALWLFGIATFLLWPATVAELRSVRNVDVLQDDGDPAAQCGDPGAPRNGYGLGRRSDAAHLVGSFVGFACRSGYRLRGERILSCVGKSDGVKADWNGETPTCVPISHCKRIIRRSNSYRRSDRDIMSL